MSTSIPALPSRARLLKATALSAAVAAVLLVTVVLPAEYDIDPTGIGGALGLTALAHSEEQPQPAAGPSPAEPASNANVSDANATLATKAEGAFGNNEGQSFDADAASESAGTLRQHQLVVELAPGKGAEVKAKLDTGEGLVYAWTATGEVAVDMHGEAPDAKGTWTSYSVEKAQRASAGTFVAPFSGTHGWYWHNRGATPVRVTIQATGFQPDLYRP